MNYQDRWEQYQRQWALGNTGAALTAVNDCICLTPVLEDLPRLKMLRLELEVQLKRESPRLSWLPWKVRT